MTFLIAQGPHSFIQLESQYSMYAELVIFDNPLILFCFVILRGGVAYLYFCETTKALEHNWKKYIYLSIFVPVLFPLIFPFIHNQPLRRNQILMFWFLPIGIWIPQKPNCGLNWKYSFSKYVASLPDILVQHVLLLLNGYGSQL